MNDQTLTVLLFVGGALLTIALAVIAWLAHLYSKIETRLDIAEKQLLEVGFKVTPLWAKVQKSLADDLHHPALKHKEMDGLLEKLEALTITVPETARLKELLIHRVSDITVPEKERASATIMATVMDRVLLETESNAPLVKVELVGEEPTEKT